MIDWLKEFLCGRFGVPCLSNEWTVYACGESLIYRKPKHNLLFRYAAAVNNQVLIGRAVGYTRRRLRAQTRIVVVEQHEAQVGVENGMTLSQRLGIRLELDDPKSVRRYPESSDGGNPWISVAERGRERVYWLDLLDDNDDVWRVKNELETLIDKLLMS